MGSSDKPIDREAFTEDGMLIFNIRACSVPRWATIEEVKKFFEKFGKVSKVRLIENKDEKYQNELFVRVQGILQDFRFPIYKKNEYEIHYEKSESAVRALQNPTYDFKRQIIFVRACQSLDQPDGQKIAAQLNKNCLDTIINHETDILKLNDDCLEHICQFLTPVDQVNFALSCRRFIAILISISKTQYKNFDFKYLKGLTHFEMCIFLQLVGPQIKYLTANMSLMEFEFYPENELASHLENVLINVEKLIVVASSANTLSRLVKKMKQLHDLEVIHSNFDDQTVDCLKTSKKLKNLKIIDNLDVTGAGIHKLTGLEQLTLANCPEIMLRIGDICKNLVNLSYLDIRINTEVKLLDTKEYDDIAKYLVQLKTLKITCNNGFYESITQLPNLTKLHIVFDGFGNKRTFFDYLFKHKADQLEELVIDSYRMPKEVASSLAKMKKLKVLRCRFSPDDEFVKRISNLKQLEEIEICEISLFTDDGILVLLKNCLKLKCIIFWCYCAELLPLLFKTDKFLLKQREQGHRTDCVHFIFKRDFNESSACEIPGTLKFSDMLKVSDEVQDETDFVHYDDMFPFDKYDYAQVGYYSDSDDDYYYNNNFNEFVF